MFQKLPEANSIDLISRPVLEFNVCVCVLLIYLYLGIITFSL